MAALFRTLYWYVAKYDCFIGAAHIKGIENGAADAVSRADFRRFTSIRPSAELSPSLIPSVLNSTLLSELSSSQAGRDCRQTDPQFSRPEDSQSLQHGIRRIFEEDEVIGKANIPGIPWESPEELVQFGSNVCGRGPAFFRGESGGGWEKDSVCSPLWTPMEGQLSEIPIEKRMTESSDQRYGSLGGVHSGRTGAQKVDGFFGMAPPDNGVNYCDIDFGFTDDLPAGASLLVPPDIGVPGGCPAGSPVTLRGTPSVPEPGRMDIFDCNDLLGNQWSDSEVRGRVWNNSSGMVIDSFDWDEPSGNQWAFPDERGRDLHDPQVERFIRPGRINYRDRTFRQSQRHNG
ncbi:MAG: hypothetical protein GY696_03150 [Gammaproteobacteria bacterium]|nr:hypothetical protein [Gammaproteobacteria bacterium]